MNDKINDEISKLESVLQSNIGEQEAYAVRYAVLILNDMKTQQEQILQAGMEGREVEFRIGGRLFRIREVAQ